MGGRSMSWARRLIPVAFCAAAAAGIAVGCSGPSAPTSSDEPAGARTGAPDGVFAETLPVPSPAANPRRAAPDEAERARARLDAAGAELVNSEAAWRSIRDRADVPRADVDDALERVREARAALDGAGQDLDWRARRGRGTSTGSVPLGEPTAAR